VLVGWSPVPMSGGVMFGLAAMLIASLFYGLGGVYASRNFPGVPPLAMAIGQQCGAAVVLLPLAVATAPEAHVTVTALLNLLALAAICTGVAYLIYYPLLQQV